MSRNAVGIKYYILEGGQAVRAAGRRAWEHWFGTTPPDARLLARTTVDGIEIRTYFYGVLHDNEGGYVTVAVSKSGEEKVICEHSLDSAEALRNHVTITAGLAQQGEQPPCKR